MKGLAGTSMVALAVAGFLASLSLVSWRQKQALDVLQQVDSLRQECSLEAATRTDLEARILQLESRKRVLADAERRLKMRRATSSDLVLLPGDRT
jgi:cell division protein FtsL